LRVGILGGAFNPPHIGHLVCAQEAISQLELDRLVVITTGQPPHRELEGDPGAEARLEMVELAIADNPSFSSSRMEIDRDGPSYTADTLRQLHDEAPDQELFLVLGGDQAAALAQWHQPEQVLELAQIAVVERTNWSRNAISITLGRLRGAERIRYLDMPIMQVSSTSVRRRVAEGRPIRYLVPDKVGDYIEKQKLYRAPRANLKSVADAPVAEASA
jgi:nicotinate-nucleotide adenylyltransferase